MPTLPSHEEIVRISIRGCLNKYETEWIPVSTFKEKNKLDGGGGTKSGDMK